MAKASTAKPKSAKTTKPQTKLGNIIWVTIAAAMLILIANTAIWVNQQVFNTDNFTETVTTSITSESSRNAIASEVTKEIFIENPIANRLVGGISTKLISGLLDTQLFRDSLEVAVKQSQIYVTSSNQEDVVVDLTSVKTVITGVTEIAGNLEKEVSIDTSNIPDTIVIVEKKNIPNIYQVGLAFLWLSPISIIGAIILLMLPYKYKWHNRKVSLITQGAIVSLTGITALVLGPLIKSPLLAQINTVNGRVVIGNMYDAFASTFVSQTLWIIFTGLLATIIGLSLYFIPFVNKTIQSKKS